MSSIYRLHNWQSSLGISFADNSSMRALAACGASRIFVPRKEMDGFEFRPGASLEYNEWHDSSGSVIKPKSMARLKVVGTRWEPKERTIMAAGTLNGDLLGRVFEEGDPTFDNGFAI